MHKITESDLIGITGGTDLRIALDPGDGSGRGGGIVDRTDRGSGGGGGGTIDRQEEELPQDGKSSGIE